MIRKLVGKTAVLCFVVALTIVLVIAAWMVTSRSSKEPSIIDKVATEKHDPEKGAGLTTAKKPVEAKPALDTPEMATASPPAAQESRFKQIEQDFAAGCSGVCRLEGADTARVREQEEALQSASGQTAKTAPVRRDSQNTNVQEPDIEQMRGEAGRIVDRSGLFSAKPEPDDELHLSTAERAGDDLLSEAKPEPGSSKDMEARRSVVLERKAYEEAKRKVDEMLRNLGYVD